MIDNQRHLGASKGPSSVVKSLCSWSVDFSWCESGHNVPVNLDKIIITFAHIF